MADQVDPSCTASALDVKHPPASPGGVVDATRYVAEISSLLQSLEEAAAEGGLSSSHVRTNVHESNLVLARLGIASGLHSALRVKHPPTASHCLRVAIACSSWAAAMKMDDESRDALEVAALLHDVGKIGVPDKILMKPGRLLPEEVALINRHGGMGEEILAHCGIPQNVLEIILGSRSWYAACNGQQEWQKAQLSPGARMLAIVDAFDSMTTDHVYRPARSRERALAELYECAGSQFDPELVRSFDELFLQDQNLFTGKLARRWLQRLPHDGCGLPWKPVSPPEQRQTNPTTPQFEKKLIENMHDGVVFVDGQSTITLWSTGAERLTGVSSHAACGRTFQPALLDMHNPRQRQIPDEACPVAQAIATGVQSIGRVAILGRQGHLVPVDMHVVPVRTNEGAIHGAIVLLHDVSSEASLEERCHSLHVQVTKDPLTQVANRAEFDRMLAFFVTAHQESHLPCSLIMCDIDQFKLINDTWGHQAGDHAIITFSSILKSFCRPGDLVARYGGEEFAILCAHCTNAAATQKADVIRKNLSETRHSCLGNRSITASFGVTELQAGDMPETLLRRADRALLQAKDQGRNQVVQLGDGMMKEKPKKSWWPFPSWSSGAIVETTLRTTVPIEVAIQKLRGFVADQQAKIVKTENNDLLLEVSDGFPANRRAGDRPTTFLIQLNLTQHHHERTNSQGFAAGIYVETRVEVTIRPRRDRDRRREATLDKAQCLLRSLKSYLMASEDHDRPAEMDHLFCEVSLPQ